MTDLETTDTPEADEKPQTPPISESRRGLVKDLTEWLRDTRTFWQPVFDRMRDNMKYAGGDQWQDGRKCEKYQVNFVQRLLNQQVSTIYAQDPTVTIERKPRMDHTVWDGTMEALTNAKAEIEQAALTAMDTGAAGGPVPAPPPVAAAIIKDYAMGLQRKKMTDKIGETLKLLIEFERDEQKPDFNSQMKSLVLREKVTGAGFLGVKFQSETDVVPTINVVNTGIVEQMQAIQGKAKALLEDLHYSKDDPCHEELRLMVEGLAKQLQNPEAKVLRQGIVYDFKPTTSILVDPCCRQLQEFVGANRVAEVMYVPPEYVLTQWQVDVKRDGTVRYGEDGGEVTVPAKTRLATQGRQDVAGDWPEGAKVCVAIIYDKQAQMQYTICDGYEDFLEEPDAPWPPVKGFWPLVALKLRRIEVERNDPEQGLTIYGQSDVDLVRPQQDEMNRCQEALRAHRIGNRPGYLYHADTISGPEANAIGNMPANTGIGLSKIPPGTDLRSLIIPKPTVPVDPALYEKQGVMQDVLLVSGAQASNLGQQMPDEKATGQAIGEQSRIQGVSSEVDEQDKFLTDTMRISGEMLLQGMDEATVRAKVGIGAVWPTAWRGDNPDPNVITVNDCLEQMVIKIEAASSGRPNQALDIANFEKMQPMLLAMAQAMGLPLEPLLRHAAKIMGFKFDLDEWLAKAQPMQAAGQTPEGKTPNTKAQTPNKPGQAPDPAGMNARIQHGTVKPGNGFKGQPGRGMP